MASDNAIHSNNRHNQATDRQDSEPREKPTLPNTPSPHTPCSYTPSPPTPSPHTPSPHTPSPYSPIQLTHPIPQSDSGICLTPQSQVSVTSPDPGLRDLEVLADNRRGIKAPDSFENCDNVNQNASEALNRSGESTAVDRGTRESLKTPERQKEQEALDVSKHSTINENIQQVSAHLEPTSESQNVGETCLYSEVGLRSAKNQDVQEASDGLKASSHVNPSLTPSNVSSDIPMPHNSLTVSSSATPSVKVHTENFHSQDVPNPSDGHRKASISPRTSRSGGRQSSDDFTFQTKYLVLQFLHQATDNNHLLHLSQNSLSTTSESEPRYKSYAERLRRQWQKNRSQSSPTSPLPRPKSKPTTKLKGSRSSPNLKDANFFKEVPVPRKPKSRRHPSSKAAKSTNRYSNLAKHSPMQAVSEQAFIRSVSENTENSEAGTYQSDADDELDTSFDSSHQGSATSVSLRNKMAHYHHQAFKSQLPTVQSETESVADMSFNVAEENVLDDATTLPIMDVNLTQLEGQSVSPVEQYQARVTHYLDGMSEQAEVVSSETRFHHPSLSMTNADEEDNQSNPPLPFMHSPVQPPDNFLCLDLAESGAVSGGFELDNYSGDFPDDTEGAVGGAVYDDDEIVGGVSNFGQRGDRSKLRLDICDQDAVVLIEAVHSLRQEIEEEISSFESEIEEAMQSHHSDYSWSGLSRSQSRSPETSEIARRLARIGDEVQHKYFDHLDRAVGRLFLDNCAGLFTYENFREAAMMALDADVHGWKQVATVLLYSQHVALHLAQSGRRTIHRIIDYTVRLLADTTADFIIEQGGWASISALDHSSTSSSPEVTAEPPPFPDSSHPPPTNQASELSLSRRSESAPDLHNSSLNPNHQFLDLNIERLGSSASHLPSSCQNVQPTSSALEQHEKEKSADENTSPEREENGAFGNEGGGEKSEGGGEDESMVNTGMVIGCAVSVTVIAVGAAVVLNLIRG